MPNTKTAQAYIDLLKRLREGHAEFQKESKSEYQQYEDLKLLNEELTRLLNTFGDKTEFTDAEMNLIDTSYEQIQTCYRNITRQNTVMNLHARDMLEGFLQKVDPEEYQHVQSLKTPVKPNTTGGNYQLDPQFLNGLGTYITYMSHAGKGWAPYKRAEALYEKLNNPPLKVKTETNVCVKFAVEDMAKHVNYLKAGEKEYENDDPAEEGLAEYETTLRELEATVQDYLNCTDIKENPFIEAASRNVLNMIRQTLSGVPVTDMEKLDRGHWRVQSFVVNYAGLSTLKERKSAQAQMKDSLWVKLVNQDTNTHQKMLDAMKLEDRNPGSPEQKALREELIRDYRERDRLAQAQLQAYQNPKDPNYQNLNRFMDSKMKDHLHDNIDTVGARGLKGCNADSIVEVLEAGWPLQETMTCRRLIAYRDVINDMLNSEQFHIRDRESPEFVAALERMSGFLDRNVKKAYREPLNLMEFSTNFRGILQDLRKIPVEMNPGSAPYQMLMNLGVSGDPTVGDHFMAKLDDLAWEARYMDMSPDEVRKKFPQELNSDAVLCFDIQKDMNSTSKSVWFGSGEFKRIAGTMEDIGKEMQSIAHDQTMGLLNQSRFEKLKEYTAKARKDIDTYLASKEGKTNFTEVEQNRIDLVRKAAERLVRLERTLRLPELALQKEAAERAAQQRIIDQAEAAKKAEMDRRKAAINGENPDWDLVAEEANFHIEEKVDVILVNIFHQDLKDENLPEGPSKISRQNLRKNVRDIMTKGLETLKAVSDRIDKEKPQDGKVKLTDDEARDLLAYAFLRGACSVMNTTNSVQNTKYCNMVMKQLSSANCRKDMTESMEHIGAYYGFTEEGIDKEMMRDMFTRSDVSRDITSQVGRGIQAYKRAHMKPEQAVQPGQAPQAPQESQPSKEPQAPKVEAPAAGNSMGFH